MAHTLVVDDEQRICRFIARSLEPHGFQVHTAATAGQAVRMAREHDYALIILDLLLPDFDGFEVLGRVLEHNSEQRVLVLSALDDVETRVRCLRLGAVDFLPKPFAVSELVERVRCRVDETHAARTDRWLVVGGVHLDRRRRVMHHGDRTIELSPREFVLLEHLMRRANEVCTRMELLGEVWGYSFDPGSNVVDVCIRRLRGKLERDLIETVRNVGYSFVAS